MGKIIDAAVSNAVAIANNDHYGYSQVDRWGDNRDCSSLIFEAWQKAGLDVYAEGYKDGGVWYTGNLVKCFKNVGFQDVTSSVNLATGSGMQKGDIVHKNGHVVMHIGDGKIVEAANDYDGVSGDSSGQEIRVRSFYGFNYTTCLRYPEAASNASTSKSQFVKGKVYTLTTSVNLRKGAGTNYPKVSYSDMTADGKAHASYVGASSLKAGTQVTCKGTKVVDGNTWMKIPSGWLCAIYEGEVYIK